MIMIIKNHYLIIIVSRWPPENDQWLLTTFYNDSSWTDA